MAYPLTYDRDQLNSLGLIWNDELSQLANVLGYSHVMLDHRFLGRIGSVIRVINNMKQGLYGHTST